MIDTNSIRNKILNLAFKGRLSSSQIGDDNVESLFKSIQEQNRIIQDNHRITKNHWVSCPISDIYRVETGKTPNKSISEYYKDGTIPFIGSGQTSLPFISDSNVKITQKAIDDLSLKIFKPHSLVIALYGEGKTRGQISELQIPATTNQACAVLVSDFNSSILTKYVKLFFRYQYEELRKLASGGNQQNLNVGKISNTIIFFPSLEEQKRIVEKVDSIFALLDEIDKEQSDFCKNQDLLRTKLISAIIENKANNKDVEYRELGDVLTIERGGSPRPIKAYITEEDNGISWIRIGDVSSDGKYIISTSQKIKPEGINKSRKVFPGDFLLTNSMSFGHPYITKIEGCIHDGWLVLHFDKSTFLPDFLYYLLSSDKIYKEFCNKASGSTVDNLNKEKVAKTRVPMFSIECQKDIVRQIEEIFPLLT